MATQSTHSLETSLKSTCELSVCVNNNLGWLNEQVYIHEYI